MTAVKVVKVISVLALRMQVGAGQSCASPSPLISFPQGETWPAENTHEQPVQGAETETPTLPTPHPPADNSFVMELCWHCEG